MGIENIDILIDDEDNDKGKKAPKIDKVPKGGKNG